MASYIFIILTLCCIELSSMHMAIRLREDWDNHVRDYLGLFDIENRVADLSGYLTDAYITAW
jgi:hypothetical protein